MTLAQTTAFTYQGRLNDTSTAANGSFDFQFTLYDTADGGNQQGSTQTITAVNVANGVFSVQLDFGSAPFAAGTNRFLEIRVKKPADASYMTLTPRQRITSVPYAIRSLLSGTADNAANLNGQPASQFVQTNDPRCRNTNLEISSCSSSLRYKNNIAPFNFGLNLVKRLKPITFNWKDGGMADLGLGAEDVAAIEPLLVTYNKDGQVEGVKYDRIGVILINAVKEQQAQIAEQRRQLEEQRALIDALRQLVCSQNSNAAVCREKRDDQ